MLKIEELIAICPKCGGRKVYEDEDEGEKFLFKCLHCRGWGVVFRQWSKRKAELALKHLLLKRVE